MPRSSSTHAVVRDAARRTDTDTAAVLGQQEVQRATAQATAELARREAALDDRERALAEREASVDSRAATLDRGDGVEAVWALPAAAAASQIRDVMIETGDDLPSVARGIGVDPEWARGVLTGEVTEVDIDHVQQLCEGLHCTPFDLFGSDAGHSISHAYGPDLWPRYIEPLGPLASRAGDLHHEMPDMPAAPEPDPELGLDLDP